MLPAGGAHDGATDSRPAPLPADPLAGMDLPPILGTVHRAHYEVSETNVIRWRSLLWELRCSESDFLASAATGSDLALLLADIHLYDGLLRRGHRLPDLETYLLAGREDWGCIGVLVRHWRAQTAAAARAAQDEADHAAAEAEAERETRKAKRRGR